MRVLALHRVPEVRFDPFDADLLVGDAARAGVLGRHKGLDEEVGDGGEEEDGHLVSLLLAARIGSVAC